MRVTILPDRDTRELEAGTVADLLQQLRLHRDAWLVIRDDQILTSDVRLRNSDELQVWPVISGGGPP